VEIKKGFLKKNYLTLLESGKLRSRKILGKARA
jgi:hypothetical protein